MADTITGVFTDRESAERALATLSSSSYNARISNAAGDLGGALVTVDVQGDAAEARQALLNAGASRVDPADAQPNGSIGGVAPSAVTDAPPVRDTAQGSIGGMTPSSVTDAAPSPNLVADYPASDYPASASAPASMTPDAPTGVPQASNTDDPSIGGVAPSAVTNANPPTSAMATSNDGYDTQAATPADDTIVTPGMEIPYTERQAQNGAADEGHPITDEDIIANERRRRERDRSADLDVPPAP